MKEAVARLESHIAQQIDHNAVLSELSLLRQTVDATIRIVQKAQRESRTSERSYGMDHAKEYAEPLIEAVTSLDWSVDHPRHAMKAIQEAVLKNTGDRLSDAEALIVLSRLVDRKLIRTRIDPPASHFAESGRSITGRKGKYFRVPENER